MKIDPKLKNRIRFNQLEDDAKTRLRRFYHLTSAESALRILQSGFIWSDAQELAPHFSSNRSTKADFGPGQDIWLTFNFVGPAHLVAEDFPVSEHVANALYVHLYEWPDMYGLDGMRVANVRVSAGTSVGLECIGYQAMPDYVERCKTDLESTLVLTRIKRLAAIPRSVRVPASAAERKEIRAGFPKSTFTTLDRYKLQLHLFKRRMVKRIKR